MSLPRPARLRAVTGLSAAALIAGSGLIAAPVFADDAAPYSLSDTLEVGDTSRDIALDAAGARAYVPVTPGAAEPGGLAWIDTGDNSVADSAFTLEQAEPEYVVPSADGSRIYVLDYRTGSIAVVDPDSGETPTVISEVVDYPSGMVEDTASGILYVNDGSTLTAVDPVAGTVSEPIAVSQEAYPLLKDIIYDEANHMVWIAEGRKGVITGYSTLAGRWVDSLAIPITNFTVGDEQLGGRPSVLAMDQDLGHLYVSVSPRLADDWVDDRLVIIDPATGKQLGSPISTGERVYDMTVNPATHEVISSAGFDNSLVVVSPETWDVSQTLDFTEQGVTDGTGTANADLWALAAAESGSTVYVTHPYTDRASVVERSGAAPTVTELPEAPGQDGTGEDDEVANDAWEGPEAAQPAEVPDGAVAAQDPALRWLLNQYMLAWTTEPLGVVEKDAHEFAFANGTGWFDEDSQRASITWADGFRIRHYAGLAPDVITTLGNPRLDIAADGTGELSFDVAWSIDANTASEGYARVVVATFADSEITVDGEDIAVTVQPDFEGRSYDTGDRVAPDSYPAEFIDYLDPAMRGWWFSSGASMDSKKAPDPFTVGFTIDREQEPSPTDEPDPTDEPTEGPTEPGTPDPDEGRDEDGSADGDSGEGDSDDGESADDEPGRGSDDPDDGDDESTRDDDGAGSDDGAGDTAGSDDGAESDGGAAPGDLPRTGAQAATALGASAVLLVIGGLSVLVSRRRRAVALPTGRRKH